jgi:hypothetical protein
VANNAVSGSWCSVGHHKPVTEHSRRRMLREQAELVNTFRASKQVALWNSTHPCPVASLRVPVYRLILSKALKTR